MFRSTANAREPWSSENEGLHIGLIYFASICIIVLKSLKYYRLKINISKFRTFILFVVIVIILNVGILECYKITKSNSKGLFSIGFDKNTSSYNISQERENLEFDIQIKITNYSNNRKEFKLALDSNNCLENVQKPIYIFDRDGEESIFVLESRETKVIEINQNEYSIYIDELDNAMNLWSCFGLIDSIILEDLEGVNVKITSEGYLGAVIEVIR